MGIAESPVEAPLPAQIEYMYCDISDDFCCNYSQHCGNAFSGRRCPIAEAISKRLIVTQLKKDSPKSIHAKTITVKTVDEYTISASTEGYEELIIKRGEAFIKDHQGKIRPAKKVDSNQEKSE